MLRSKRLLLVLWIVVLLGVKFNASRRMFHTLQQSQKSKQDWAQKTLQAMSLREKIGQLLIVRAYTSQPLQKLTDQTIQNIQKYHVGGLLVLQFIPDRWQSNYPGVSGQRKIIDPADVVETLNSFQKISKVPLLVSIDAEWGLGMTFKGALKYPKNMTLAALQDEQLVYEVGKEIGRQCKLLGIHINFAPVVDINTNAKNPIIGRRSFGDNKHTVARKGLLYMQGMQHAGVLACAKHFPGHGDTAKDSHKDLPTLRHPLTRLYDIELHPFKRLIKHGVDSVMVAHLNVEQLDGDEDKSCCLSEKVVSGLLKKNLGFKGLVFSDSFCMHAISKFFPPGQSEVQALKAGIDVIVLPKNVKITVDAIEKAVKGGELLEKDLDERVLKLLRAKQKLGLHCKRKVKTPTFAELNSPYAQELKRKVFRDAAVLVAHHGQGEEIKKETYGRVAVVQVGGGEKRNMLFVHNVKRHPADKLFYLPLDASHAQVERLIKRVKGYDCLMVGLLLKMNPYGLLKNLPKPIANFLQHLKAVKNNGMQQVIAGFFTTPYAVKKFDDIADTVLLVHQKDPYAIDTFFDVVFDKFTPLGKMPLASL